ncbi:[Fe-Fe] hydrogenase large subunit C-terminal domain-containing protein [Gudongella sp. DL1XJH-153]|uniref:[Fe-Fe] hydrogenase large subunit C-terminal domain-containing protein n=1 Tax=Gudongella sp. DL1XJH-153 TaxID=3409804 RepID=UPI003BB6D6EE
MSFIDFDIDKCEECYKCLRTCPTKSISFNSHRRYIIEESCIKCGLCQMGCSSGALSIHLDIDIVRALVKKSGNVIVSLAPSFAGSFNMHHPNQMATALKKLGFSKVEETARGAEIVSMDYERIISEGTAPNLITSCCPSSNTLIEHYYPDAISQVIPVISPMIAHGYDIKSRYPEDSKIVFIGPCLAKKAEAMDYDDSIDYVITFRELEKWLEDENVDLKNLHGSSFDTPSTQRGKAYPLGGSLWRKDLKTRINPKYKYIHVDGIEACMDFLKSVESNEINGFCAELNICAGSCMNGPDIPKTAPGFYKRVSNLNKYIQRTSDNRKQEYYEVPIIIKNDYLFHTFTSKPSNQKFVSQEEIDEVLNEMGKITERDRIDCGACGYSTCYEKAVAVSRGYSDIHMCMDYLRKKAEGLQSIIFETSPNAICILDNDYCFVEINPSFRKFFNSDSIKIDYLPLTALVNHPLLAHAICSRQDLISKKIELEDTKQTFIVNLVQILEGRNHIAIFTDITEAQKTREEMERVKAETLLTCQEVIENQMRVAQEIASILGETTADTKIGLNKLKKLVLAESGDKN